MKTAASSSPPWLGITNFTETAKEQEEDVAEEGPGEDSGLALAVADPSAYELENGT